MNEVQVIEVDTGVNSKGYLINKWFYFSDNLHFYYYLREYKEHYGYEGCCVYRHHEDHLFYADVLSCRDKIGPYNDRETAMAIALLL